MTTEKIYMFFILIILFSYLLERLLDYLNSVKWSTSLPNVLQGIYKEEEYIKSMNYEKAKQTLSLVSGSVMVFILLFLLYIDGFAVLDSFVRKYTEHPILMALLFFGVLGFLSDIVSTPFSVYSTFVIEEKFGFNKTTPKIFILDKLKGYLLGAFIGGGLLSLIVWVYTIAGDGFWLIAWAVIAVFMILLNMFYSSLIVPLFNKQTPLEEGEVRTAIEDFAQKAGFKLRNIFVIDGSKRSSKSNAYFSGLGPRKRIVLFDTLIKEHTVEELVAVLAHEVGHYKKKHTLTGMLLGLLQTGLMLFILSKLLDNPLFSEALGAEQGSFHMGILAFAILYSPLSLVLEMLLNAWSRKNEYQADRYAGEQYKSTALQLALKKLSVHNLSNLQPHPAYVFFYYSHPPLLKRLQALEKIKT